jgi:hypothetical protein
MILMKVNPAGSTHALLEGMARLGTLPPLAPVPAIGSFGCYNGLSGLRIVMNEYVRTGRKEKKSYR